MESKIEGNMTGKLTLTGLQGPFSVEGAVRSAKFESDPKTIGHEDGSVELLAPEAMTVTLEFSKVSGFNVLDKQAPSTAPKVPTHFGKTKDWVKENVLRGWRGPEGFGVCDPGEDHVCEVCGGRIKARTREHQEFCVAYTDRGQAYGEMRQYLHIDCLTPGVLLSKFTTLELPLTYTPHDKQDSPLRAQQEAHLKDTCTDILKRHTIHGFVDGARKRKERRLADAKALEAPEYRPEVDDVVKIPGMPGLATILKVVRYESKPYLLLKYRHEALGDVEIKVYDISSLLLAARGPLAIHSPYTVTTL